MLQLLKHLRIETVPLVIRKDILNVLQQRIGVRSQTVITLTLILHSKP